MAALWNRMLAWRKQTVFLVLLATAALVALILSEIASVVRNWSGDSEAVVLVAAPTSGPDREIGRSIRTGVDLYVRQLNRRGGLAGLPLRALPIDEADPGAIARALAGLPPSSAALGAIGYWSDAALAAARPALRAADLPLIALAGPAEDGDLTLAPGADISFLANYVRNILGERTIAVIAEKGAAGEAATAAFDQVLQRFASKLVFRWDFDATAPDGGAAALAEIAATVREKMPVGSLAVLAGPGAAARAVAALRRAGVRNRVVGPSALATSAFVKGVAGSELGSVTADAAINGVVAVTPLLFDTANTQGQNFRESYLADVHAPPDWIAATAFEASRLMLGRTAQDARPADRAAAADLRRSVADRVAGLSRRPGETAGPLGTVFFDGRGRGAPSPVIGVYDGHNLVAAPTQLSPILDETIGSYLDELAAGRALYVNNKFMYKTNVVYAGLYPYGVSALNLTTRTVTLDFQLWFRWRGDFEPQDVVFMNAETPIRLDTPEREGKTGDIKYRSYHVKGSFFIDYAKVDHPFGTHVIGVAFHHRVLGRNNLMYVNDILGMRRGERTDGRSGAVTETAPPDDGWVGRFNALLRDVRGSTDMLARTLTADRVLAGVPGWRIGNAWLSQDVVEAGSNGDPFFVGFGRPAPLFSHLDLGMVIKRDEFQARDLIASRYYLYIAIFAFCGSVLARLLDGRERGQFWRMQTLGLRVVCWPLLLTSVGNMALDYGLETFSTSVVDLIDLVYQSLWWLVPSRLLVVLLERFLWSPLELRTGRRVPNVIRLFAAALIYLFAIFGVVAFVMGQTITSLLATSGVLAMVIGLAIQANIANVFSGIVLNIERPFKVGDLIRIGSVTGEVVDITWRTTRIRSGDGQLVCLANGKVSESEIHNFSDMEGVSASVRVHVAPEHDPERVIGLIGDCLEELPEYQQAGTGLKPPEVRYAGVECVGGFWMSAFVISAPVATMGRRKHVTEQLWNRLWRRFHDAGIVWRQPSAETVAAEAAAPMASAAA